MVRVFSQKDKNTGVSIKNYSSTRKYVSTRECLMDHFIYQKWVIDLGNVVVIDWTRAANHLFPSSEETLCTNRAKLKNLPVRSCARPLTKFQEGPTIEFFARRRHRWPWSRAQLLPPWVTAVHRASRSCMTPFSRTRLWHFCRHGACWSRPSWYRRRGNGCREPPLYEKTSRAGGEWSLWRPRHTGGHGI